MVGVSVTFQYDEDFDRARVVSIAENARGASGLYGVEPTIDFVEIAELVDNAGIDARPGSGT